MLSGVGPAAELKRHDIPIVADLPGVGSQLMDHLVLNLNFRDKTKSGVGYLIPKNLGQTIKLLTALVQYRLTGRGPLTTNVSSGLHAPARMCDNNTYLDRGILSVLPIERSEAPLL